ncbi:MAG: T9SS type A sorting domain-containing protein [Dysgonomonas sp.]
MKKIKLLLLTVLILSLGRMSSVHSQTDIPIFPTSDAMWSIYIFGYMDTVHYIYGLSGDTVINEKTYNKLYLLNDSLLSIDENDVYVAGIRQEGKVVFMQPAMNRWGETLGEFMLYDFSKTVGDSVSFDRPYFETFYNIPTFEGLYSNYSFTHFDKMKIITDTVMEYGRKLQLGTLIGGIGYSLGYEAWVEGIGSLSGFFFAPMEIVMTGWSSMDIGGILTCMKQGDKVKYLVPDCTCMGDLGDSWHSFSGISGETTQAISLVYDKNVRSIVVSAATQPLRLRLIALDGKLAASWQLDDSTHSINVSHLPAGIYIYRLSGNNLNQTGKLILN